MPHGTKIHLDRDARDERHEICNLWKNKLLKFAKNDLRLLAFATINELKIHINLSLMEQE